MWRMLQLDQPQDFVIATGRTSSLRSFVDEAFRVCGLDWEDHVVTSAALLRPTDIQISRADPAKAAAVLGWRATKTMSEVIRGMLDSEL